MILVGQKDKTQAVRNDRLEMFTYAWWPLM